jgi:hypothetical protein
MVPDIGPKAIAPMATGMPEGVNFKTEKRGNGRSIGRISKIALIADRTAVTERFLADRGLYDRF